MSLAGCLSLLTMHPLTLEAWAPQAAQVRTMLGAMRAMQQSAGQPSWAMLMGDFNSIPGSAIYRYAPWHCAATHNVPDCHSCIGTGVNCTIRLSWAILGGGRQLFRWQYLVQKDAVAGPCSTAWLIICDPEALVEVAGL